ncbi:diguanylate cyclase [Micromonospora sp. WMMC415]|uniref:GGDEF domain-containing protein n=1 Tax=Micromonospora sp. WMMC415 TaxID=2675222 RepID=UPI0012B4CC6A|nr:GGDEF domain-containing protein [Micromonospora sp. WMMC415]QGN49789.1 diguanylate cyclase [Micromonospora sp. WMMC415]
MSPTVHTIAIAVGGILAGLALAGTLLWQQQQAVRVARYQATHDDVTGLPNRRMFLTRLRAALADNAPVGVVLLDLDRFKTVNDTLGHDAGNDLLDHVGRLLAALRTPVEIAARLSGDEFALLVRGDPDEVAAAAHAASRVLTAAPIRVVNGEVTVAASVGYTHTHDPHASPRQLLAEADAAMYHAKRAGTGVHGHHPLAPPPGRRSRDRHYH